MVSLDSPTAKDANGKPLIDQLGTSNVAPLIVGGQINPALAANNIQVIKDTHGKTSHLSAADFEALTLYLRSLDPVAGSSASASAPSGGNATSTVAPVAEASVSSPRSGAVAGETTFVRSYVSDFLLVLRSFRVI